MPSTKTRISLLTLPSPSLRTQQISIHELELEQPEDPLYNWEACQQHIHAEYKELLQKLDQSGVPARLGRAASCPDLQALDDGDSENIDIKSDADRPRCQPPRINAEQ